MKGFCGLLLLPFLPFAARAVPSFRPFTGVPVKAELLTRFHFSQFVDGVVLVHGRIEPFPDTLNFLLDTGSGGISVDSSTALKYTLPITPSNTIINGIGGSSLTSFVRNRILVLGGLVTDSLDFHVSNYDLISALYGIHIDGIIGYSFLKHYIVGINYDDSTISIYSPGVFNYPKRGQLLKPLFAGIPLISAPIRNIKATKSRFFLDTGAGLCLLLTDQFVQDNGLMPTSRRRKKRVFRTVAQGLLGQLEMKLTTMQEIRIGTYIFHNVPALIFKDVSDITDYPFLGGIMGNELLRRFNLVLNYPAREIHLEPNIHFREGFDYSYTGLAIYYLNGSIKVTNVIPGSPADKAGLKPGDLLLGIDHNFSGNIQQYIGLLRNAGHRVNLLINRKGKLMIKTLPIKSFQ